MGVGAIGSQGPYLINFFLKGHTKTICLTTKISAGGAASLPNLGKKVHGKKGYWKIGSMEKRVHGKKYTEKRVHTSCFFLKISISQLNFLQFHEEDDCILILNNISPCQY